MLELSKTNQLIKEDLDKYIKGAYDAHISPEQVQMALELSFLFNHISADVDTIIFEYSGVRVKINNIYELSLQIAPEHVEDTIIYQLKSTTEFQSAFLQFKRDYKIKQIL
jgi:hypothetical protein